MARQSVPQKEIGAQTPKSADELRLELISSLKAVRDEIGRILEKFGVVFGDNEVNGDRIISHIYRYLTVRKAPATDKEIVDAVWTLVQAQGKKRPKTLVWVSIKMNSGKNGPLAAMDERYGSVPFKTLRDRSRAQKKLRQFPGNLIGLRDWLESPPK